MVPATNVSPDAIKPPTVTNSHGRSLFHTCRRTYDLIHLRRSLKLNIFKLSCNRNSCFLLGDIRLRIPLIMQSANPAHNCSLFSYSHGSNQMVTYVFCRFSEPFIPNPIICSSCTESL